ncbi:hypothetical protein ABZ642_28365 [Streptomyces sp. NPDC007157]|uniref:hypothetical protein n=1 Tax=Streptomyces sp. NPDC007157 TaxID=3154681 RepID=UPI003409AEC7
MTAPDAVTVSDRHCSSARRIVSRAGEVWFRRTAAHRGYSNSALDEVWETVASFGAYGFCRAHAVAFAVPALQSAVLKARYPPDRAGVCASIRVCRRAREPDRSRFDPSGPRFVT